MIPSSLGHLLDETRKMAPALFLSCHVIGRWNGAEAAYTTYLLNGVKNSK